VARAREYLWKGTLTTSPLELMLYKNSKKFPQKSEILKNRSQQKAWKTERKRL